MKQLVKFVRNEHGQPIGAVVAIGRDKVGWSICHKRDEFDRKLAVHIATERARKGTRARIPDFASSELESMTERAQHYFK